MTYGEFRVALGNETPQAGSGLHERLWPGILEFRYQRQLESNFSIRALADAMPEKQFPPNSLYSAQCASAMQPLARPERHDRALRLRS